tara:strand:- start:4557 stop:4781 length:225 start_codon:yes stop_codon:yes gene_type:complete
MIDPYTLKQCKKDNKILQVKINNLEYAIKQSQAMICESKLDDSALIFLRSKIADSIRDLEVLYLLKNENETNEE